MSGADTNLLRPDRSMSGADAICEVLIEICNALIQTRQARSDENMSGVDRNMSCPDKNMSGADINMSVLNKHMSQCHMGQISVIKPKLSCLHSPDSLKKNSTEPKHFLNFPQKGFVFPSDLAFCMCKIQISCKLSCKYYVKNCIPVNIM